MSYPESPVVVLPLICPSRALALYVAHHDGKALVGVAPPKPPLLLPSLSVGCASAAVVLLPRVGCQQQQQQQLWPGAHGDQSCVQARFLTQPAGVHTLELTQFELQPQVFISWDTGVLKRPI